MSCKLPRRLSNHTSAPTGVIGRAARRAAADGRVAPRLWRGAPGGGRGAGEGRRARRTGAGGAPRRAAGGIKCKQRAPGGWGREGRGRGGGRRRVAPCQVPVRAPACALALAREEGSHDNCCRRRPGRTHGERAAERGAGAPEARHLSPHMQQRRRFLRLPGFDRRGAVVRRSAARATGNCSPGPWSAPTLSTLNTDWWGPPLLPPTLGPGRTAALQASGVGTSAGADKGCGCTALRMPRQGFAACGPA